MPPPKMPAAGRDATRSFASSVSRGEVHVRYASLGRSPAQGRRADLRKVLSPEEERRMDRLAFEADRWQYLAAHVLLRSTLSSLAPVPPQEWVFAAAGAGKPEIVSPELSQRLRFSLTHTSGLVACAISSVDEVGVDAERMDATLVPPEVSERFLSGVEQSDVATLPAPHRVPRLFELWALKEAYLKARGDGLSRSPGDLTFGFGPSQPARLVSDAGVDDDPAAWRCHVERIGSDHVLAVAVRAGAGRPVRFIVRAAESVHRAPG